MSSVLKPYSDYKPMDAPWCPQIPVHWNSKRLGSVLKERGEVNHDYAEQNVLSVMRDIGVIPYADKGNVGNKKSEDIARYKIVRPNDIVLNSMNVIIGSVGRSRYQGCLSPVYYVLTPRNSELTPEFAESIFQVKPFQQSLVRIGYGILAHRMRIPMELLKSEVLPLPPPDEQAQIVRFIRHLDHRVNRLIKTKRRLIELLNEQKQAIIHRAVTRGLDPTVPLKPSGIEWLGEIPVHWNVKPLKSVFREVDERTSTGDEEILSVSHLTGVTPRSQKNITMFMAESYVGHKKCRPGDLVANTMWMWMGALGVSQVEGILSPSYAVYRPKSSAPIHGAFLDMLTRTRLYIDEYTKHSTGIRPSRLRLYPEQFLRMPVLLPPFEEQAQICNHLHEATQDIVATIGKANGEIDLIREYRTRLVADVVTGQFDVRHLDLPDVEESLIEAIDAGESDDPDEELEAQEVE